MSKEIREQINKVKNWKPLLNESLKDKLSFLEGKPISLIKTHHTTRWNDEKGDLDKITSDEDVDGIIGQIGNYNGYETPGFWIMDDNGKRKGFVMYDKKIDKFVEGDSIFHYTYQGKTEKDNRILQLFLNNSS